MEGVKGEGLERLGRCVNACRCVCVWAGGVSETTSETNAAKEGAG